MSRRGNDLVASLDVPFQLVSANVVRDFVRSVMLPDVLARIWDIGMGITQFEEIVPEAGLVLVEAPPAVQLAALRELKDIGMPRQLGLVDGSGKELPGVFVAGEGPELEEARAIAASSSFMGITGPRDRPAVSPAMQERIDAGEFTIVEIDENAAQARDADTDNTAPIPEPPPRLEQEILARRRARRAQVTANPTNGTNGKR